MTTVKELSNQLQEIAMISNQEQRHTAAVEWWNSLSPKDQEKIRDEIIAPIASDFIQLVEILKDLIGNYVFVIQSWLIEIGECMAYISALEIEDEKE